MINYSCHPRINSISGSLNVVSENFEIKNSNGLDYSEEATYIAGLINTETSSSNFNVSGIGQDCCRTLENFHPEQVGEKAKSMCVESIDPIRCELDKYSVIFEPYAFGEILAFVISPNFNLKTYHENRSCFSQRLHKPIASENFSLIDDPHHPEGIGSKIIDDEGVPTETFSLIKNGKMNGVYSDLFTAYKESEQSTGNASRPGSPMGRCANPNPIPLPHNLKVEGEPVTEEELIKDTRHGIIIGRLWYTYPVNPIKGDFSCTARSGIKIIENGQIKNPGKPVRIIHNLLPFFKNIAAIGDNPKNVIQWASLPSTTPLVKVENVPVCPI